MEIGSLNTQYLNNVLDNAGSSTDSLKKKLSAIGGRDKERILTDSSDASKPAGSPDARVGGSDDELMEVCKEFEAYFMEQVFKNMKSAMVPSNEESSGSMATLKGYYEDEMMKEYARSAAGQSTNGLAQMLFEQMKRNYSTTDIPSSEASAATPAPTAETEEIPPEAQTAAGSSSVAAIIESDED